MSECEHEYDHYTAHCSRCGLWCGHYIAQLQRQLGESEKLKQGYYNEAAEGWKKYRERRTVTDEQKESIVAILEKVIESALDGSPVGSERAIEMAARNAMTEICTALEAGKDG